MGRSGERCGGVGSDVEEWGAMVGSEEQLGAMGEVSAECKRCERLGATVSDGEKWGAMGRNWSNSSSGEKWGGG